MELVAADIGGTHARFALAEVADGRVVRLGEPMVLRTGDHGGLDMAWQQLGWNVGGTLPGALALAVASPVGADEIRLTNNDWVIRPARFASELGVERHLLINDFGAVAHAVQHAPPDQFAAVCGPPGDLPDDGAITICGPGTGLGVAQLIRGGGAYRVIETEGGHIGFSASDPFEDALVAKLRERHGRVSAERVCAGPAILSFYATLSAQAGWDVWEASERAVWDRALDGSDDQAVAALDRFLAAFGTVAGDLALAQGATAVVIAGGLGLRLRARLATSGFAGRFAAKGRFRGLMESVPVKLITHPQPGLFGAAAAFAQRFA